MTKDEKQTAHEILCRRFEEQQQQVAYIESRLHDYFSNLCANPDYHNGYEILCGVKFLRLLRTYEFNHKKVAQVVRLREGEWRQDADGRWEHVSGGIKCPGTDTMHVYRWQPFQIFVLASVFGFYSWFDTRVRAIDKPQLLPTERVREDGIIEDLRRVCNYFVMYTPRKTDKTGLSAYIQVIFFLLGDNNSEIYCCANAEFQSEILYGRTQTLLRDIDTQGRFRMTHDITAWKTKYKDIRNSFIMPLTAGGKTKDGPFAELVNWDELGSSPYVNGKSDMFSLVNVMRSSMGPRREGLTFGTTTAGTIQSGPFIDMLDNMHAELLQEIKFDSGEFEPSLSGDRSLCLLLEPDDWEKEDENYLISSIELRKKINPMLGITVQHQFYDDSIEDMYKGKMTKGELLSKLYNVYQSAQVKPWMPSSRIMPLQVDKRITDCRHEDGWLVFTGLDFTRIGDDLLACTYLGVNMRPSTTNARRWFADCDVWILEEVLKRSPNKLLYEEWIKHGWMQVCPGETFDPDIAINSIMDKCFTVDEQGNRRPRLNILAFGYDAAQSRQPINQLKAWLYTLGITPENIEQMVVPVPQTALAFNPIIGNLENMILQEEPWINFSKSPLWPYCFGNARIEESTRNDLKRVVKSGPNNKIDPVHALLDALYCWDKFQSKVQK